jgi:hypothetical protein
VLPGSVAAATAAAAAVTPTTPTATAAAARTATATAATTAEAAATTAAALRFRPSLIDIERTAIEISTIEGRNRAVRFRGIRHFDERKTA